MPSPLPPAIDRLSPMPRTILGYVVRFTGKHQIGMAVLSIAVFALSAVPLELQRRIVNGVVEKGPLNTVLLLAAGYAVVALAEQSLKLALNVYRGWVAESSVRELRQRMRVGLDAHSAGPQSTADAGVEISLMIDEAEPVGGFVGISLSEPLLQVGILVNVIGYMLVLEARLALLGLVFFLPQLVFVPLIQGAINRRAATRILVKREISEAIVESVPADARGWALAEAPIQNVFTLNMGIYKLKFSLNLLMNLMYHLSVAVALSVGGWLALKGRFEIGTVVAIVGGLGKLNDPWGDLVNWVREFSVVGVKYRLFADAVTRLVANGHRADAGPVRAAT
jgi:ABC-type bacteriocin/lantibiotic exporter with double-glycine peptidase domain